jgi:diguanylate cyclase (GGDEF)-like protein
MMADTSRDTAKSPDIPTWRLTPGHVIAIAALGVLLVAQVVFGALSVGANEADRRQLLSHESDASALTFTQRESFTVLQRLDRWSLQEATVRDVFIARANLGRRLGVVTTNGHVTFDLVHPEYQRALQEIDVVLEALNEVADSDRAQFRMTHMATLERFDEQTRALSSVFQKILETQTDGLIGQRTQSSLVYLGLLALATGFLTAVALWIGFDLNRAYRSARRNLDDERESVRLAGERLRLLRTLEDTGQHITELIHTGASVATVRKAVRRLVETLLPGEKIAIRQRKGVFSLTTSSPSTAVPGDDRDMVLGRATELVRFLEEREGQRASFDHQLTHDPLTGLANRRGLTAHLDEVLKHSAPGGPRPLLIAIDVNRFRDINSAFGFEAGDDLLKNVAGILSDFCGKKGFLARVAADEFAIVLSEDSEEAAQKTARSVHERLIFTAQLEQTESLISCSTGAVWVDKPGESLHDVVGRVGLALHLAKMDPDENFVVFDEASHSQLATHWLDDLALQQAFREEQFLVFFQPIMSLESGAIAGFEALVRWDKPGTGLVPPGEFLAGITRAGLTHSFGQYVIENALIAWHRSLQHACNGSRPYVTINVDAKQLTDEYFSDFVLATAERLGVPTEVIVLEVTEHAVVAGEVVERQLDTLRRAGARIALDDFGTGYSNLSQLYHLPIDIIKLDRSFLTQSEDNRGLLVDVVQIAQRRQLVVVAEGIEEVEMRLLLVEVGVTHGQGYLFTRALPEIDIISWADTWHQNGPGLVVPPRSRRQATRTHR